MAAQTVPPAPPATEQFRIELPKYRRPGEPERYRLSAARLSSPKDAPLISLVQFWFGTRYIRALAAQLSDLHPHILELRICPSPVASFIKASLGLLPPSAQFFFKRIIPEWFLPDRLVLKQQKQGQESEILAELFDTELEAYRRLQPLQGEVIPTCYGQISCFNGTRAILVERLGGVCLSSPEGATLCLDELSNLLQPCYRAMHAFGVHHDDPNLSNFQLVGDKKIMVMDLESAVFDLSADEQAFFTKTSIERLAGSYLRMQVYYRQEGSLEGEP